MKLSLIIPVHNEEENLPILQERIEALFGNPEEALEIIYIDDGSTDGSFAVLRRLAQDGRVRVIRLARNYGQTAAIAAGFAASSGEIIVPLDADLQNDPADISKLVAKLNEGYDVVSGWRRKRKDNWLFTVLPSKVANYLISWITAVKLHDYGCTLKAYRREVIKDLKLYGEMHRFLPAYAAWYGAKVTELETTHHPRIRGRSKYSIGKTFRVVLDLLVVKFFTKYANRPMHFFGGVGFWSFFISGAALAIALYWKITGQKDLIQTPLPLFAALFFLIGAVFILMGLLAEILTRTYHESQRKSPYVIKETINAPHR
ncbi:glycosyltransferase family 2 protein [Candidatus Azambacteria bacterium]|nr:glycosyltransferase family 2 protein [Candidatus Azambacteria bacterium]